MCTCIYDSVLKSVSRKNYFAGTGVTEQAQAMFSEKRLALDGNAYTREEFLAFYGPERFDSKWASATMLDSATAGTSIANNHQAVATERAAPLAIDDHSNAPTEHDPNATTVAHATAADRPQTDAPEHIPNTTIVAQANAVEHTRERKWRFTNMSGESTDDESEVCTVYDTTNDCTPLEARFNGFQWGPERFQWAAGNIHEQCFLPVATEPAGLHIGERRSISELWFRTG